METFYFYYLLTSGMIAAFLLVIEGKSFTRQDLRHGAVAKILDIIVLYEILFIIWPVLLIQKIIKYFKDDKYTDSEEEKR